MSLHDDLLEQAEHLLRRERRRPRQASLRRSVSAAYYALFHLLVDDAARAVAPGASLADLRDLVSRAFDHGEMRDVARAFGAGGLPSHVAAALGGGGVPADLQLVAARFVDLQEIRHAADYNVGRRFTRQEVQLVVAQAQQAFAAWDRVRRQPEARVYVTALLLWRKWRR